MKKLVLVLCAIIMCLSTSCSSEKGSSSSPTPTVENSLDQSQSVPSETGVLSETPYDDEYQETLYMLIEEVYAGNISNFIPGKDCHLIFKIVESTFDEPAHVLWGVVDSAGKPIMELTRDCALPDIPDYEFNVMRDQRIDFIGENCFVSGIDSGLGGSISMYNAMEDELHIIDLGEYDPYYSICSCMSKGAILDGFYNGVIINKWVSESGYHEQTFRAIIITPDGTVTRTNITTVFDSFGSDGNNNVGVYSEGLFWAFNGFYDLDCNLVIDLSQYDIENTPYFSNGTCLLTISKNGELWNVHIDQSGNFLDEPTKINSAE